MSRTAVSWARVAVALDQRRDPLIIRESVHSEVRRSETSALTIAPSEFAYRLTPGVDFEVQAVLLGARGEPLWSSRLFLIWSTSGFKAHLNHPVIENSSTNTRHVAFTRTEH